MYTGHRVNVPLTVLAVLPRTGFLQRKDLKNMLPLGRSRENDLKMITELRSGFDVKIPFMENHAFYALLLDLFNAESSPERYLAGPRSQEGWGWGGR